MSFRAEDLLARLPALEPKTEDFVVFVVIAVALTYPYWSNIFGPKPFYVPRDYWYMVPQASSANADSAQKKAEERKIANAFTTQNLDFIVFWGSQSGRAEILARQFAKSLHDRFGLRALAADLDDFDVDSLEQLVETQRVVFILSTYGDGDPPDNVCALWSYLNSSKSSVLSSLRYLIFGLGNTNYRLFNQVAKTVDDRLQTLGATRLAEPSSGDDANGNTENDFLAWRRLVQSELKTALNLTEHKQKYQPAFTITEDPSIESEKAFHGEPWIGAVKSQYRGADAVTTAAPIQSIHKLWETEDRTCLHVDVDLGKDRRLKYKTGDHLSILACNPDQEVDQLFESLASVGDRHVPVSITPNDSNGYSKMPIPSPNTLDALFRNYLEICGTLSLDLLGALADFAPTDAARAEITRLYNDPDHFKATIISQHTTLSGLLNLIGPGEKWNIPISFLLERLKPMQPRYYSIASSAVVNPRTISITVVVDKLPSSRTESGSFGGCYGVATSYLWGLERAINQNASTVENILPRYAFDGPQGALTGNKIYCSTAQSNFKLPMKSSSPIIMVGAGTGVAPFRGFVQERLQRAEIGNEVGRTLLFMGFRNKDTDFIYRDDWAKWQEGLGSNVFKYWTALSRDADKKQYVQDLIKQQGKEIMDLLEVSGCRFYICGSATMARGVVNTLVELRIQHAGCSKDDALSWVKKLRQFDTLLEDVWG